MRFIRQWLWWVLRPVLVTGIILIIGTFAIGGERITQFGLRVTAVEQGFKAFTELSSAALTHFDYVATPQAEAHAPTKKEKR